METMPVVCVDGLVINDRGEFLLVKRKNEPLKNEYWLPGGRLHKGESLKEAIQRKMRQELGVDVEILQDLGYFEEFFEKTHQNVSGGFHAISFIFLVRVKSNDIKLDAQSAEWKWFTELPPRLLAYPPVQQHLNTRKSYAV